MSTTAADLVAAQQEIVDSFALLDDWTDRYQYLIDLGRQLPPLPEEYKTEEYRLKGCQSQVWIKTSMHDGLMNILATSDSAIVAGLIALLLRVYGDRRPADILATPPDFIREIKLDEHLSPTRSNGLAAMIQQIRQMAVAALAAELQGA